MVDNRKENSVVQQVDPNATGLGKKVLWRRGKCELWYGSIEGEMPGARYFVAEPGVRPVSFEGLRDAWLYFRKLTDNSVNGSTSRGSRSPQSRRPEHPAPL